MSLTLALFATLFERFAGYPNGIFVAIGHPVTWMGSLITWLEKQLNRQSDAFLRRRLFGVLTLAFLLAATVFFALTAEKILHFFLPWPLAAIAIVLLASSLIAQNSLFSHVEDVADALENQGLEAGRQSVSMIVGRDTAALDEAGVARAAIESLAENFSDGIAAPVFWMAMLGLPGAAAYKAINTADSMIGHKNARYHAFGWAAARLDDLVNLPASRLTALLFIAAAWLQARQWRGAVKAVKADARHHRSPNAGWPEAAMAGVLDISLAGPRRYGGETVEDVYMNAGGRREASASDIRMALRLAKHAAALLVGLLALVAIIVSAAT